MSKGRAFDSSRTRCASGAATRYLLCQCNNFTGVPVNVDETQNSYTDQEDRDDWSRELLQTGQENLAFYRPHYLPVGANSNS